MATFLLCLSCSSRRIARELGVQIRTSYRWCWWLRNAALSYEMDRQVEGTVEADALYHTAGKKGQAHQGGTKPLGRRPRRRRKKREPGRGHYDKDRPAIIAWVSRQILEKPYATLPALAPLAPGPQFDHLTFETYGCPAGHEDNAIYTTGLTRAPIGNGRIQVEGESGYRIEPGYSGAPVWCDQVRAIIGLIAQDERDSSVPAGFVIPSTLLLQACPVELREAISHDQRLCRDSLVRGIDTRMPTGADAIRRFLDTYLGRPDQPVPFGGRGRSLQALDDWLADPNRPCQLLTAPAGRGKSALLAQWVVSLLQRQMGWDVIFLPISIRFQTSDELTGLHSLAARLELFFPRAGARHEAQWAADDYKAIIRNVLDTVGHYPGRHFVLVIDAIDEAMQRWFDSTLLPYDPPPNLKILVSARYKPGHQDGTAWLDELDWAQYPVDEVGHRLAAAQPPGHQ